MTYFSKRAPPPTPMAKHTAEAYAPPPAVRILAAAYIFAVPVLRSPPAQEILDEHLAPVLLPMSLPAMGIVHAMTVHMPSLWSQSVHQLDSVHLMENMVYYPLLQIVALTAMELSRIPLISNDLVLWDTALYFAVFYAWHIHTTALLHPNCTLSCNMLTGSMCAFIGVTVAVAMGHALPVAIQQQRPGEPFMPFTPAQFKGQLIGMLAADLMHTVFVHFKRMFLLIYT